MNQPAKNSRVEMDELPSPTCAKTLLVLELLGRHPEGLSSADASRRTGITANLVFRILKTLAVLGYANQRESDKRFVLTQRMLDLSHPREGDRSLVLCAHEAMKTLRDTTGETVQIIIEADGKGLVLEQFRGTHALQVCGQVGMRVPLYSCAPGKAIMAYWGEARLKEWFRGRSLKRFTENTLSRRIDLETELESIRVLGFATDRAEGIEGIHCVAAPVFDEFRQPVAAITVMAPIVRFPEDRFEELGALCRTAAGEIEKRLKR